MDERRIDRAVTEAAVTCHTSLGMSEVSLWNLSPGGCLVEGLAAGHKRNASITVELLEDIRIGGTIVWQLDAFTGIAFSTEVPDFVIEQLDVLRSAGLWMGETNLPHPLQYLPPQGE